MQRNSLPLVAAFVALGSGGLALGSTAFPQPLQLMSFIFAMIGIAVAGLLLGMSISRRSPNSNEDPNT